MKWIVVGVAEAATLALTVAAARPGMRLWVLGAWVATVLIVLAVASMED